MPADVGTLHEEAPLTDLHAHPSLKAFLFRRNLWRHYASGSGFNPFSSRSDFKVLSEGGVGVLWASHYLPERRLFRDCFLLRSAAFLLTPVYFKLTTGSLFERLLQMMDALEREIDRDPSKIELATSSAEVDRIRREGKIAVVHTVEGTHVLEKDPSRITRLAERGVAMLTLVHFYPTGVAAHVDALPRDMAIRNLCSFDFGHGKPPLLTDYGREILRLMVANRMIVDVTHCWPEARELIYAELNRERPIVASHVGVKALNDDPYNLSDDEIREIAASGGVVGVILMPYWLGPEGRPGLDLVVETIEHISKVTGNWDHVAIGSDFDGFTEPPAEIEDASQLGAITQALLVRGVSETDVKKVLGGNAARLLRTGWR